MGDLLELKQVEISFGRGKKQVRVTQDVSFSVQEGEMLSLVGESGCGKSVTALSILGLGSRQSSVTHGEILYRGQNLLKLSEKQMDGIRGKEIAMIFQDIMYSLNPVFTVGSQMIEGMRRQLGMSKADAVRRAIQLLNKTGIRDAAMVMKKYPHQLSGGMRQRVMIAMALSCKPKLLIADEPTTALDVTIQMQIMELLRAIREETGMAMLLITHDIGVVTELADRVVVMYAGQCIEQAPIQSLLKQPLHPYTHDLLRAVPGLHDDREKRLYAIPGTVPERYDGMTGCRFAPRCEHAAACRYQNDDRWYELSGGRGTRCGYLHEQEAKA